MPLNYADPIRQKLKRGERTLFVVPAAGHPVPPDGLGDRAVRPGVDRDRGPVCPGALRYVCPAIIGLVFVYVGYYMLIGRFIHDMRERRRTWYTVTDRRCLIVVDGKIIETKSVYWNFIQGIVREQHGDGTATVYFELTPQARKEMPGEDDGIVGMRRPPGVYFERLDDPAAVECLVMANVVGVAPVSED